MSQQQRRDTRTRDQLTAEAEFYRRAGWANQVGPTARYALVAGCIAYLGKVISESVVASAAYLAGKTTQASVAMSFLYNLEISIAVAWCAGAGGVAYGYAQRRAKKKGCAGLVVTS